MIPLNLVQDAVGQNLSITDEVSLRHEMCMGKSGSGKTEYIKHRLRTQIMRGGGAFFVDAKLDYDMLDELYSLCATYGRAADFRVVNIDNDRLSHTYSPFLRGDDEEVASRFMDTIEAGSNSSGEHFRQMGNTALRAVLGVIKEMGIPYNAMDLHLLLSNPEAMEWLYRSAPEGEKKTLYATFLDGFRTRDPLTREYVLNADRLRSQIGGVAMRLFTYGTGSMGKVLGSYNPEVDLLRAIDNNQIVYFMCPTLAKNESALAFAKMFLSDLKSVIATLYKRAKVDLPPIPHLVIMDEFGSYAMQAVAPVFEMARGARIELMPAFQSKANLTLISTEFADQIIANTDLKTFLTLGDPNSCELAADVCGQTLQIFRSRSYAEGESSSNRHLDIEPFHRTGQSSSESEGLREAYDYRVRPEVFAELPVGSAILKHGKRVFRVRFPMVRPAEKRRFELTRYDMPPRAGLDLLNKFNDMFSLTNRNSARSSGELQSQ